MQHIDVEAMWRYRQLLSFMISAVSEIYLGLLLNPCIAFVSMRFLHLY